MIQTAAERGFAKTEKTALNYIRALYTFISTVLFMLFFFVVVVFVFIRQV